MCPGVLWLYYFIITPTYPQLFHTALMFVSLVEHAVVFDVFFFLISLSVPLLFVCVHVYVVFEFEQLVCTFIGRIKVWTIILVVSQGLSLNLITHHWKIII